MNKRTYVCPKCSGKQFETDVIRTTGGRLAKLFDIQNKKFTVITCSRCKYSELYKGDTSTLGNIFDFLAGG